MDESQVLKCLQGTTRTAAVGSSTMLVPNYTATRCQNPEDNKNFQGCGNFKSVTRKQNSGFSSAPRVCSLFGLKTRNGSPGVIRLRLSASHKTYASQGIKERRKQALILPDVSCRCKTWYFLSRTHVLLFTIFADLTSSSLVTDHQLLPPTAEALSTRRHGVTVLIIAVDITTNRVFYSHIKSKCKVKQSRYRPGVAQRVPGS